MGCVGWVDPLVGIDWDARIGSAERTAGCETERSAHHYIHPYFTVRVILSVCASSLMTSLMTSLSQSHVTRICMWDGCQWAFHVSRLFCERRNKRGARSKNGFYFYLPCELHVNHKKARVVHTVNRMKNSSLSPCSPTAPSWRVPPGCSSNNPRKGRSGTHTMPGWLHGARARARTRVARHREVS